MMTFDAETPRFLTTAEVSQLTRLPEETLRYYRATGQGPKSFKLGGRRVLYAREDVEAFVAQARAADSASVPA